MNRPNARELAVTAVAEQMLVRGNLKHNFGIIPERLKADVLLSCRQVAEQIVSYVERRGLRIVGTCENCRHRDRSRKVVYCSHWMRGAPNGEGCTRFEAKP